MKKALTLLLFLGLVAFGPRMLMCVGSEAERVSDSIEDEIENKKPTDNRFVRWMKDHKALTAFTGIALGAAALYEAAHIWFANCTQASRGPEFYDDIKLVRVGKELEIQKKRRKPGSLDKPVLLFTHGFGANKLHGFSYMLPYPTPVIPVNEYHLGVFNFPEVCRDDDHKPSMWLPNAALAQGGDIKELKKAVDAIPRGQKIVGFGVSRGAATWLTFLGSNPEYADRLSALILEAPFADATELIDGVMDGTMQALGLPDNRVVSTMRGVGESVALRNYSRSGIKPIDVAKHIPTTLPIFIMHSKEDEVIPYTHSLRVYSDLKEVGHNDVYLLQLDCGGLHCQTFFESSQRQEARLWVRAFLEKHGLPTENTRAGTATRDVSFLEELQPSIEEVREQLARVAE